MFERLLRSAGLVGVLLASGSPAAAGPPQKTRIVLITFDTLRYDAFAGGPDRKSSMPATRAFARRGQTFERFYSATSTTQPTHASLLTGLHPWQHGVSRNGQVLDAAFVTLAERLKAAGFRTAAVVASFPLHRRFGFAQGFDIYRDQFSRGIHIDRWAGVDVGDANFYSLAGEVTTSAVGLIDAASGPRQFFWFHYFDPHSPYGDSADEAPLHIAELLDAASVRSAVVPELTEKARRLYDVDTRSMDDSLEGLFRRLLADAEFETHILACADHGESFGESGSFGHGKRLTAEQVHVPFFVVSPRVQPGSRADATSSVDVAATILSLAGLDASDTRGRDLTIADDKTVRTVMGMRRTYAEPFREQRADGSIVLVDRSRFFAVVDGRLYAGDADGVTKGDLAGSKPGAKNERLLRSLFGVLKSELDGVAPEEVVDEQTLDRLESLGYTR
jgi:choline-sulfatase